MQPYQRKKSDLANAQIMSFCVVKNETIYSQFYFFRQQIDDKAPVQNNNHHDTTLGILIKDIHDMRVDEKLLRTLRNA